MRQLSSSEAESWSSWRATSGAFSGPRSGLTVSRSMATPRLSVSGCGKRLRALKACSATQTSPRTRLLMSSRVSAKSSPATAANSMPSAVRWLESLSPWPEEFGLGRMRELLRELGDPQRAFPSIHVVGTNGKTTTTRLAEALLAGEGLSVGTYTSPHVVGWAERIRVGGAEADLGVALARVRGPAQKLGATQFEVLTAAALAEFAAADVDVAVVEAGLGGRHDATNVLDAPVVVLTNVSLEHTDVLGGTREEIAAEKLAVLGGEGFAVLGEPEWEEQARAAGARGVIVAGNSNLALALAAVETFLGRPVDPGPAEDVWVPGRMERISDSPLEIWDGAHNLAGVG